MPQRPRCYGQMSNKRSYSTVGVGPEKQTVESVAVEKTEPQLHVMNGLQDTHNNPQEDPCVHIYWHTEWNQTWRMPAVKLLR